MQSLKYKADNAPVYPFSLGLAEMGQLGQAGLHLAIGMFDGVHLGHRAVILSAHNSARADDALSGVLTFDPHPSHLFRPDNPTRMLMPVADRLDLLQQLGVDYVCCHPFNREFAAITADDFLPFLRHYCPGLKAIYVGENFRFGKGRAGDVGLMSRVGSSLGISVFSAERIKMNAEPISSTRIRSAVEAGNITEANALLGYHYNTRGVVIGGRKIGREIGFPTLNLAWQPECLPRFGVYFVRLRGRTEAIATWQPAIANYGMRPTIEGDPVQPLLECHVLGETQFGEGAALQVEWLEFLRPEERFGSLDALKAAIARDKATLIKRLTASRSQCLPAAVELPKSEHHC
jgi:riboflavin kinase/FMN adenylyltransferase